MQLAVLIRLAASSFIDRDEKSKYDNTYYVYPSNIFLCHNTIMSHIISDCHENEVILKKSCYLQRQLIRMHQL